jgi:hypothetical protein
VGGQCASGVGDVAGGATFTPLPTTPHPGRAGRAFASYEGLRRRGRIYNIVSREDKGIHRICRLAGAIRTSYGLSAVWAAEGSSDWANASHDLKHPSCRSNSSEYPGPTRGPLTYFFFFGAVATLLPFTGILHWNAINVIMSQSAGNQQNSLWVLFVVS